MSIDKALTIVTREPYECVVVNAVEFQYVDDASLSKRAI